MNDQRTIDDQHRLTWIMAQVKGAGSIVDLAGPSSALLQQIQADTGATSTGTNGLADVALCCDLLQSLTATQGRKLLKTARARTLVVTVPNRNAKAYRAGKRQRFSPVRDFSAGSLAGWLDTCGWKVIHRVEPIVGTVADSIWLGAVCHRK